MDDIVELKLNEVQRYALELSNRYYKEGTRGKLAFLRNNRIPAVVARIIEELKKEEGFTYADAHGALQLTAEVLDLESQFLGLAVNSPVQLQEPERDHLQK
ncbi:hypothetical protein H6A02_01660 [Veillonella magna]|uniref:hypothetical protein n=1 Tax=Veillonella magna TaxID=464322 RepID=UPI001960D761|nr:hypothetical protein [Veillonella magna]MBM6823692.1 hypothetical protein [Veillonella magna]